MKLHLSIQAVAISLSLVSIQACSAQDSGGAGGQGGGGGEAGAAGASAGAGGATAGAGGTTAGAGGTASQAGSAGEGGSAGGAGSGGAGAAGAAGSAGAAGGPAQNGGSCKASADCVSGHCVDSVCCNAVCDGVCDSCSTTGSVGTCGPAAKGKTCRASASGCDAAEVCDGTTTVCPADALVAKDGPGVGMCLGYVCDGTTGTCKGSCATTSDCADGYTCISKVCTVYKHVFTSTAAHDGNFGGLVGADKICQDLAKAAGLTGTYLAWLTDSKQSPLTRFTPYSGPYALVTGSKIANDFADLTDGLPGSGVIRDEKGASVGMIPGWTGMTYSKFTPVETCKDWTSADPGDQGTALYSTWGQNLTLACNTTARLYCVEQ